MKAFSNTIVVIFLALLSTKVTANAAADDREEAKRLYYTFATEILPELNEAMLRVQESTPLQHSMLSLNQLTVDVYKDWHDRLSQIQNTPIPETASLIAHNIAPAGFARLHRYQILPDSETDWLLPSEQLIIRRLLHYLGLAFSQNPDLKSAKEFLEAFFSCDHLDCQELAIQKATFNRKEDITGIMQIYTSCIEHPGLTKSHKIQLCKRIQQHPDQSL